MLKKFRIKLNDKEYIVEMEDLNPEVQFQSSGNQRPSESATIESTAIPQDSPPNKEVVEPVTSSPNTSPPGTGEPMVSPMPGTILDVFVSVGDTVTENQPVLVLEAMKMENKIVAPTDGKVTSILVQKGQAVDVGTILFTVE